MPRLNIKPAASGMSHHKFDVSSIATLDFGEFLPTRVIETVKKDNFSEVSANGILRLAPQVFPTFGKCFVKSAAFYVPEYQLFEASDAFHSNMTTWKGKPVKLPYFEAYELNAYFSLHSYLSTLVTTVVPSSSTVPSPDTYDFHVAGLNSGGQVVFDYYKLTRQGQYQYKIFKSLGYDFAFLSYSSSASLSDILATGAYPVSALPLLAYAKIWADFFLNPQFYNSSPLVAFLNAVQFGTDYSSGGGNVYTASTGKVSTGFFSLLFNELALPYQQDYYLDAWNSPNSPDGLNPSSSMISDNPSGLISPYVPDIVNPNNLAILSRNTVSGSSDSSFLYDFPASSSGSAFQSLSNFGFTIFQKFDKFVRRRGLSGNKAVERIYSMFGIKSDFFSSHYCHKIFDSSSRIDFNPVLSNSDTVSGGNGMTLGSYAGYASSGLNFKFSHKCDSFGFIICLSWIQIVPMNLHGVSPTVLRNQPFDFYTPDYDGMTVRSIPQCEVQYCKSGLANSSVGNSAKKSFGFFNLYDDYRFMKDSIVGDFVVSANAKSFVLSRDFFPLVDDSSVHLTPQSSIHYYSPYGPVGNPDISEIFQMSSSLGDRFYLQLDFHIEADRPIKSKSDAVDLNGEGDLQFSMNGNSMS